MSTLILLAAAGGAVVGAAVFVLVLALVGFPRRDP